MWGVARAVGRRPVSLGVALLIRGCIFYKGLKNDNIDSKSDFFYHHDGPTGLNNVSDGTLLPARAAAPTPLLLVPGQCLTLFPLD